MKHIDLSLVVPCYNEAEHLAESIREIESVLKNSRYSYELLFIDDKSTDDTKHIIKKIVSKNSRFRSFFHKANQGRGKTVCEGIMTARGTVVGFIDIDLEVSPVYIPYFTAKILSGTDIASGHRIYRESIHSIHRAILSKGYSYLVRRMLGITIKDTETGYKFFNRKKILSILAFTRSARWFWDTEIMTIAYYKHFKILEIPVLFLRRSDKHSTVNIFKDTIDYFINLFRFRMRLPEILLGDIV